MLYIITSSAFCVLIRINDINRITLSRVEKLQNPQNMRQDIMVRVLRSVLVRGSAKRTKRLHSTNIFEGIVVQFTIILDKPQGGAAIERVLTGKSWCFIFPLLP